MWRHFIRQLFGRPVGGVFNDIWISYADHGAYRIRTPEKSLSIYLHTKSVNGSRVSTVKSSTLLNWEDGSELTKEEKSRLLAALAFWLQTQGNVANIEHG